jgi:hypothetical protein
LVEVYNRLGSGAQSIKAVADFQKYLQERMKILIQRGELDGWKKAYSPR